MAQPTPRDRTYHTPVMVAETVSWMAPAAHGWIVDGTFGGGGHSRALLDHYPDVRIIGLDRDPDAVANAFADDRLTVIGANYRDIGAVLDDPQFPDLVDGILLDFGVSSHQLDVADRGFSYHSAGPLDMRMGPDAERSAAELVNSEGEDELARIFRVYGEERFARRIAKAIVTNRPFNTTTDLASCIADAVPAPARRAGHPARRTFQALRIAVNDELSAISDFMSSGINSLAVGGRLVVMAYHSLEDRIVKRALIERSKACTCPPDLPACACGAAPDFALLTRKAIKPSEREIENNPRARSAVMRVAERISA
ncbi:MAG: 16S rRNA (cytosine(1402)-N(4))-methyltransferase RsmH [Acidimicrobiia bacterium]|nr:16S rRNA (cytosine(1402)-N(4))-methyltransferase RsmH [Acidimicrobiia bacterium]